MLAYKVARAGNKRVIITLEIPEDAKTNIKRNGIVNKYKAQHRCSYAKVIKIEDDQDIQYDFATSGFYSKYLEYKINEITESNFDDNLENVYSSGIHFFLEKELAYNFGREIIRNGLVEDWYDNGSKLSEYNCINGKREGLYQSWYKNGQKSYECNFVNNIKGICHVWDENGKKY